MKRLLYILMADMENAADGVAKKAKMQLAAFAENGLESYCIGYGKNDDVILLGNGTRQTIGNCGKALIRRQAFWKNVIKHLKSNKYDVCYVRYPYCSFQLLHAFRLIRKGGANLYLEIPTYPYQVETNKGNRLLRIVQKYLDKLLRPFMKKYVQKCYLIGIPADSFEGIPAVNIPNGINPGYFKKKEHKAGADQMHIICCAHMFHAHGFDRLIQGLVQYQGDKSNIFIHMVGDGPELSKYKNLVQANNLEKQVLFHGYLAGDKLDEMFDRCNLACGSLGMHRGGFESGSPLKTKEYLSRGIPFIYAYKETGLPEDFAYAKRFPANEEPIDFTQILEFFDSYKRDMETAAVVMREYAEDHFTWKVLLKGVC